MKSVNTRFSAPAAPQPVDPFSGVLLIDKPMGPTSHDIVNRIRRGFGIKKVGHGGTLDPMATGLLIMLLGKGTKLSDRFLGSDKTYEGTLHLGAATDSQDAQGEVTDEGDPSGITEEQVREAMTSRIGDSMQMPPMVSAVKVAGKPLYKHARKGKTVERKARLIHLFQFKMLQFDSPDAEFVLRCTKGTYVRTLCHDIGIELGCYAHLSRLRRTRSGSLDISQALPLDQAMKMERNELLKHILPIHQFT
ncbi:MAG: tRNA pseudouridine(55) synthase TruB [Verrucomicrobia bacterium]|jgi:tRNA pseudouridine55 synthase|nr:tRNA pseudouridine(55) synthase TruB [Verrucomicrobiota bacterium]